MNQVETPVNQPGRAKKPHTVKRPKGYRTDHLDLEKLRLRYVFGKRTQNPGTPDPVSIRLYVDREAARLEKTAYDPRLSVANPLLPTPELERARQQIQDTIQQNHHIMIYGDFDCDGVTSTTLMRDLLLACGARPSRIHVRIPHRIKHGYGLQEDFLASQLEALDENGDYLGLFIAVDCGTNDVRLLGELIGREVNRTQTQLVTGSCPLPPSNDLQVLVLDHHQPTADAKILQDPNLVMINPKLWLDPSVPEAKRLAAESIKDLCAAGLVYLLADAIAGQKSAWSRDRAIILAGLATCADVVPLEGINRLLLKASIDSANDRDKLRLVPGLFLMVRRPKGSKNNLESDDPYYEVDEELYGFEWGPCLNAPGRMATAHVALELLMTEDGETAAGLVEECRQLNRWRQSTTAVVTELAVSQAIELGRFHPQVILLHHQDWHPGVVGIVASRIKDKFLLPTFVCAEKSGGGWRGSGRSVAGDPNFTYRIGDVLHQAQAENLINRGGGHDMAGGLDVDSEKLEALRTWLNHPSRQSRAEPQHAIIAYASVLAPDEWAAHFEQLGPFGNTNPSPILYVPEAELQGIRARTIVRGDFIRWGGKHGYVLKPKSGRRPATLAKAAPRPKIRAYEGIFRDVRADKIFQAHWLDLEMAEKMWDVHNYFRKIHSPDPAFNWRHRFRLQLQLRSYVPSIDKAKVKSGEKRDLPHNFQILQCVPYEVKLP